jgi:hypothetical protein
MAAGGHQIPTNPRTIDNAREAAYLTTYVARFLEKNGRRFRRVRPCRRPDMKRSSLRFHFMHLWAASNDKLRQIKEWRKNSRSPRRLISETIR